MPPLSATRTRSRSSRTSRVKFCCSIWRKADCSQHYPMPRLSSPASTSDSECEGRGPRQSPMSECQGTVIDDSQIAKAETPGSPSLAAERRSPGMTAGIWATENALVRRDHADFHFGAAQQLGDLDKGARRIGRVEVGGIDRVHRRKVIGIGAIDG